MNWRHIFNGNKLKAGTNRDAAALFVMQNTSYDMFSFNGSVYTINSEQPDATRGTIKYTLIGEVEQIGTNQ